MERVAMAMRHEEPDRVPVYPILAGVTRKLVGADYRTWSQDAETCAAGFLNSAEQFDIDCVVTLIDLSVECDAWGQKLIFPQNEAAHPDYSDCVIKEIEDYGSLKKADWRASDRMRMHQEVCRRLVAKLKGEKPVVAFVFGPLGVLSMLRGQQEMYMDLYDDPDAVRHAARQVNETLKEYVAALCDTGVDAVMFDTLFASGSIMRKDMWDEMEGVLLEELAAVVHSRGCQVMLHNCGQRPYFDVQIRRAAPCAFSFLYPPDDCASFAQCKEKYGKDMMLIGCVTPANAVIGTDEEWDRQCMDQIDAMAAGGGFMLATGCEYPASAAFDRARRMIDIAKTHGRYRK